MRCFRYVEDGEWADIALCGSLRPGANSCGSGKWFAGSETDAWAWGKRLDAQFPGRVICVRLDDDVAEATLAAPNLDGIGPALYDGPELMAIEIVAVEEWR